MKLTPYRKVAMDALINWNGMNESDALKIVTTESFDELDSRCYAESSVSCAALKLAQILGLSDNGCAEFVDVVLAKDHVEIEEYDKLHYSRAQKAWRDRVKNDNYEILNILSEIHDKWVEGNASKFNKEGREGKRYQHLPIELIGWKEAKADLLFVKPVLNAIGVEVNEEKLQTEFNRHCAEYIVAHNIDSHEKLEEHILNIGKTYHSVTESNTTNDAEIAKQIADQVVARLPETKVKENFETEEH